MGKLIAVAGLAGAGKTTAIDYLKALGAGKKVYVGELVLSEVRARGLEISPENEKLVRVDLRHVNGPQAFAALAAPAVVDILGSGGNVLLDAIFNVEEYRYFREHCGGKPVILLAIAASFDVRADRLRNRSHRKLTRDQLKARDEMELTDLRIDRAIAEAYCQIVNEGSLEAFKKELGHVWEQLACNQPR